jgi:hypothetical protein
MTGEDSPRFGIKHTEEAKHKMSIEKRKTAPRGKNAYNWKGKYKTGHGYVYVNAETLTPETRALVEPMITKGGYILEHRLIVAVQMGRPLKKKELVHHINGNTIDNRPENLALRDISIHSQEHREIVRQIGKLQNENRALKSLLATFLVIGLNTLSQQERT